MKIIMVIYFVIMVILSSVLVWGLIDDGVSGKNEVTTFGVQLYFLTYSIFGFLVWNIKENKRRFYARSFLLAHYFYSICIFCLFFYEEFLGSSANFKKIIAEHGVRGAEYYMLIVISLYLIFGGIYIYMLLRRRRERIKSIEKKNISRFADIDRLKNTMKAVYFSKIIFSAAFILLVFTQASWSLNPAKVYGFSLFVIAIIVLFFKKMLPKYKMILSLVFDLLVILIIYNVIIENADNIGDERYYFYPFFFMPFIVSATSAIVYLYFYYSNANNLHRNIKEKN